MWIPLGQTDVVAMNSRPDQPRTHPRAGGDPWPGAEHSVENLLLPWHDDKLAKGEVMERDRPARAGNMVDVDAGLRNATELETVEQSCACVPERACASGRQQ